MGFTLEILPAETELIDGGSTPDAESDLQIVLDGADAELFDDGTSVGSSSSATLLTGTGGKYEDSNMTMDAIETWPIYVNLFKI